MTIAQNIINNKKNYKNLGFKLKIVLLAFCIKSFLEKKEKKVGYMYDSYLPCFFSLFFWNMKVILHFPPFFWSMKISCYVSLLKCSLCIIFETSFYLENCHFGCGYKRDVLQNGTREN